MGSGLFYSTATWRAYPIAALLVLVLLGTINWAGHKPLFYNWSRSLVLLTVSLIAFGLLLPGDRSPLMMGLGYGGYILTMTVATLLLYRVLPSKQEQTGTQEPSDTEAGKGAV